MKQNNSIFWAFFNIISKAAGFLIATVCGVFEVLLILEMLGKFTWLGSKSIEELLILFLFFLVLFVLGTLMVVAKPFNPMKKK